MNRTVTILLTDFDYMTIGRNRDANIIHLKNKKVWVCRLENPYIIKGDFMILFLAESEVKS